MNGKEPNEQYLPSNDEKKSLDLLHEGQEAALNGELNKALERIEQSLSSARTQNDPEWVAYLEGTIAYLSGNLGKLKTLITGAGDNTVVLSRLAKGLERRGIPNYKEDYEG